MRIGYNEDKTKKFIAELSSKGREAEAREFLVIIEESQDRLAQNFEKIMENEGRIIERKLIQSLNPTKQELEILVDGALSELGTRLMMTYLTNGSTKEDILEELEAFYK